MDTTDANGGGVSMAFPRGKFDPKRYEGHKKGPWKIYYDRWEKTGWYIDSIARYLSLIHI